MKVLLSDGARVFDQAVIYDAAEQASLNALLDEARLPAEIPGLTWLPDTSVGENLRPASLRERAEVVHAVNRVRAEQLEKERRAQELQRAREELQRLLLTLLGEAVDQAAMKELELGLSASEVTVTAEVDALLFRVAACNLATYRLELCLRCPECSDCQWTAISGLGDLGALLLQGSPPHLRDCPMCEQIRAWQSDPFRDE